MFEWLTNLLGSSARSATDAAREKQRADVARWRTIEAKIKARYDAALTTEENSKHWSNVDYLSAKSANDYGTRRTLRARAGYEIANNCWARGIVNRRAAYLIGRGPRLQVQLGSPEESRWVERAWNKWASATGFVSALRTMAVAKGGRDGEGLAMLKSNSRVADQVKLYVQPIEADQCTTPSGNFVEDGSWVDGVELDEFGNPATYHILRNHPGDALATPQFDRVPARFVLHWFRKDRPGQVRGMPEIAPGLDLFAQLRRWTAATLMAAEIAASYAMFIKTTGSPEETDPVVAMSTEEIYRGTLTAMPQGWEPFQLRAEQPTTMFGDFEHAILVQLCSVLDIPFGMAIGDFSKSSYASGRLDVQGFVKATQIERGQCNEECVERVFTEWLIEGSRIPGYLPDSVGRQAFAWDRSIAVDLPHVWRWDAMPHIDIKKEIDAYATAVNSNFCTRHYVAATVFGEDWDEVVAIRGVEAATEDRYGVQVAIPGSPLPPVDNTKDEVLDAQETVA